MTIFPSEHFPKTQNLEMFRGDDFSIDFNFIDENGELINITGWTLYFTMKDRTIKLDVDAIIKKDVTIHTNAILGQSRIILTHIETLNVVGVYQYDVQIKTNANIVQTIMRGTMKVKDDVSRRY